jgi:transcriptional regulator with XRE-family HTH domain
VKTSPDEPDVEIGRRLREFREALRISRTSFALEIGIGSERLASYESGRAPLKYEVFSSISKHYFINPIWLGIGQGEKSLQIPFEDSSFSPVLRPKMIFRDALAVIVKAAGPPGLLSLHHKIMQCGTIIAEIQAALLKNNDAREVLACVNIFFDSWSNVLMAIQTDLKRNLSRRDSVTTALSPQKKLKISVDAV